MSSPRSSRSPPGLTSEPPDRVRRPITVNVTKVKEEFTKLAELYAEHSKDMATGDSALFSQYAAKYKDNERQYDNLQTTLSSSDGPISDSLMFDRFLGIDTGSMHSARSARANNFAADMQYYVIEMSKLIENFLPDDW